MSRRPLANLSRLAKKRAVKIAKQPDADAMTAEQFTAWLAVMTLKRITLSDAEAAKLLGVHANTVANWKRQGAPKHVAYACAAIDAGLSPWRRTA